MTRYTLATILLFIGILLLPRFAKAQETALTVSPALLEFDVVGGEVFSRELEITNHSDRAWPLLVRVSDFDTAGDFGGIKFYNAGEDQNLAARFWLNPDPKSLILAAGETRKINIAIKVPAEALIGSHYAAVVVESRLPSYYYDSQATRVLPQIGVLALFNVQKYNTKSLSAANAVQVFGLGFSGAARRSFINKLVGWLGNLSFVNKAVAGGGFPVFDRLPDNFIVEIKNNNLFHIRPQGRVEVLNIFDRIIRQSNVEEVTIMPNKSRKISVPLATAGDLGWKERWHFGKYQVVLDMIVGNGEHIKSNFVFWVVPWQLILSTVALFGVFIYFVLKYKQRLKVFMKILWRGPYSN
jgi:hypothetical protein